MFSRATIVSRPVIASAAIVGTGVTAYYITRPNPVKFDSAMSVKTEAGAAAAQKKTFSSAIWSKELKVAKVEQVNHDTKRITFQLPSEDEVSGISPSGPSFSSIPRNSFADPWHSGSSYSAYSCRSMVSCTQTLHSSPRPRRARNTPTTRQEISQR